MKTLIIILATISTSYAASISLEPGATVTVFPEDSETTVSCTGKLQEDQGIFRCDIKLVRNGFVVYDVSDNQAVSSTISTKQTAAEVLIALRKKKVCK